MSGYVINPMSPLPKRWEDQNGGIRVMCEPCEGYVMARRKGAAPFVISVHELLSGKYRMLTPIKVTEETGGDAA